MLPFVGSSLRKKHLRQAPLVPWDARWTVVSWAHRPAAVPACAALHRPAPPRPAFPCLQRLPHHCTLPRPVLPKVLPDARPCFSLKNVYRYKNKRNYFVNRMGEPDESKFLTYHGRVGVGRRTAGQGGWAGRGGAGQDTDVTVRQGDNRPSCFPWERGQLSWMSFCTCKHRTTHVNRWRNTMSV